MNLIYQGSVKDIFLNDKYIELQFTDNYSIFDWGRMPDIIPYKGYNLYRFTTKVFQHLEKAFTLAYKGDGILKDSIKLEYYPVIKPEWRGDKYIYDNTLQPKMIPLEVIFRWGVPEGSSLIEQGYKVGDIFGSPLIEYTTKYENIDRKLNLTEAYEISGLLMDEFIKLESTAFNLAYILKSFFEDKNITLYDGKFEFAVNDDREILLTDAITPDELRLSVDGEILSKEFLRKFYKDTVWYNQVKNYKSDKNLIANHKLKDIVKIQPLNLDKYIIQMASELYKKAADLLE